MDQLLAISGGVINIWNGKKDSSLVDYLNKAFTLKNLVQKLSDTDKKLRKIGV